MQAVVEPPAMAVAELVELTEHKVQLEPMDLVVVVAAPVWQMETKVEAV